MTTATSAIHGNGITSSSICRRLRTKGPTASRARNYPRSLHPLKDNQMLYPLLGASGLRTGEALYLEIDKHISKDFSTLYMRQKVSNGRIEPFLKTDNGTRDMDLPSTVAALLKNFIGG